jgi:histidine triad (HIT) family protein
MRKVGAQVKSPKKSDLTEEEKQAMYRDARAKGWYDGIWQTVGKCVFCDLREKYIVYEEDGIVLTISLYAYIDGQMMVVPRRHVRSVKELTAKEWEATRKMFYLAKKMIREVHGIKGMQIVQKDGTSAQGTVEHLHFHCIPFDAPDLCEWNYRELKYTPMENAKLYRDKAEKIRKLAQRFEEKYEE